MTESYTIVRVLGEGSFGKCYLVKSKSDGAQLVIKQISLATMSRQEQTDTLRESKILEKLDHPNIVKFREVYKTKRNKLCIVMEYADGGDMAAKLQNQRGVLLSENQVLDYFVQICLALKHVHDRKILHRDLKSQNIFLMKNDRVKLGDFGIAKVLQSTRDQAHTMVGTPYYLSPEIVQNQGYSFKSDIWSLGVLLYEMCALQPPFQAQSIHALALNIIKGQYPPLPRAFSRGMSDLVAQLLSLNPDQRPSVHQILKLDIIQRRIAAFLSSTMTGAEFSHTVLHGINILDKKSPVEQQRAPAESDSTPAHNQQFMQKLEEAKVAEDKRQLLVESVKQRQQHHTMKRDEFAAVAQKVMESLRTEEEKKEEKVRVEAVINELDDQALIYDLQLALVQHPSEAVTIDMPEPTTPSTDRDDDIPDSTPPSVRPGGLQGTSGISKIEGMRALLEDQLGTNSFIEAYRIIREINDTIPEDQAPSDLYFQRLRHLMTIDDIEIIVPQIQVLIELEKEAGIS